MSQVQFLKGTNENSLSQVPLTPGAIFFTEETMHLYIDTDTARLPVKSDFICGKIFWVQLLSENWANSQQTVTTYYETKEGTESIELSTLLTDESIIFIGQANYGSADDDGITPAVVAESSTENDITFKLLDIDGEAAVPQQTIWVQLYCPNAKTGSEVPIEVVRTVFTTRIKLDGGWNYDSTNGKYYQTITIPNIDFSTAPFFVNLSDDSLENRAEYQEMEMSVTSDGSIQFSSSSDIIYNIQVDICIFLAWGLPNGVPVTNLNGTTITMGEWTTFTVSPTTSSSFEVTSGALSDIASNETRELLIFCTQNNNVDFAKITKIDYSTDKTGTKPVGVYSFTLADGEKITSGFNCVVIQLNNIATIRDGVLQSNDAETDGSQNPWTEVTSQMLYNGEPLPDTFVRNPSGKYYYQYWPASTESADLLKGKYMPLVLAKNGEEDSIRLSEICETKLYSNRIQFVVKEEDFSDFEHQDLEIRVIDFI